MRRINNETIANLAKETAPEILWRGPFKQLINTAVEAGFADQRTYVYNGTDVDHQVHLGFDLASTAMAPVRAANRGRVVHAGWLGIYGNCVVLDHGMGLQSLYAHLSSIGVSVGQLVESEAELGRSGATGLSVRLELQADCFAGIWAHTTEQRQLLEAGDVDEALKAASVIGDDALQRKAGQGVRPESFTHGSSEQRMRWFKRGYETGEIAACDTFEASAL